MSLTDRIKGLNDELEKRTVPALREIGALNRALEDPGPPSAPGRVTPTDAQNPRGFSSVTPFSPGPFGRPIFGPGGLLGPSDFGSPVGGSGFISTSGGGGGGSPGGPIGSRSTADADNAASRAESQREKYIEEMERLRRILENFTGRVTASQHAQALRIQERIAELLRLIGDNTSDNSGRAVGG